MGESVGAEGDVAVVVSVAVSNDVGDDFGDLLHVFVAVVETYVL